jgi:methylated-DNA-[protein]-cysteine S-methyltransferase
MTKYTIFKTKWGYFALAGTEKGIFQSWLPGEREKVKSEILRQWPGARYEKAFFRDVQGLINAYFEGDCVNFGRDIPVVLADGLGRFARRVLAECRRVRFGKTISYGKLAEKAGSAGAARAAGNALAGNHLPLIIPCHRVICADGKVGGFSAMGAVLLKKRMLKLEEKALETA